MPWEKEALFSLPAATWKSLIDFYYPDSAWLCLRRDVFDQLYQYQSRHGLHTWEQTIEHLLATAQEPTTP